MSFSFLVTVFLLRSFTPYYIFEKFLLSLIVAHLLIAPIQCNNVVYKPVTTLSYSKTTKQRSFHFDAADHYTPTENPNLDQVILWKNFIFITAKDNIFKIYRNSSQNYNFRYSMSLPQSENCSYSKEVCERRVQFLLPYTESLLFGCYSYAYRAHFFTLNESDFKTIHNKNPLYLAMQKFCSLDPKVETLVFQQDPNSFTYLLAEGISKNGFQLQRKEIASPEEMKTVNLENWRTFNSLEPGVKRHVVINNNIDKSRVLGENYPVSQFSYNGSIFVTFKERAVELNGLEDYKNTLFSRIAKVCKSDGGVQMDQSFSSIKYWASFAKAKIVCSVPGTADFIFSSIQDTVLFELGGFMFAIFDTPYPEMRSSAICLYDLKSVTQTFAGKHYDAPVFEPSSQRNPDIIKDYKPSECTDRSEDIDTALVNYLHSWTLMEETVRPVAGEPVFRSEVTFRLVSITGENAQWLNHNNSNFYILYTGTDDGKVLKLVVNVTNDLLSEDITSSANIDHSSSKIATKWVTEWQPFQTQNSVKKVLIDHLTNQLFITSQSEVVVLPKSSCSASTNTQLKTCKKCLQTRDPHCFWKVETSQCVYSPTPNSDPSVMLTPATTLLNAFLMFEHVGEVCDLPLVAPDGDSAVTSSSSPGDDRQNGEDDEKDDGIVMPPLSEKDGDSSDGVKDEEKDLGAPVDYTNNLDSEDNDNGLVIPNKESGDLDSGGNSNLNTLVVQDKEKSKSSKLLTITLATAIPCIIMGVLVGMGLLYCYAFYRANKHSKVTKSPNEVIYAPIVIGNPQPNTYADNQQNDPNCMYQQIYAQYLQIDSSPAGANAEDKHYSTIGSIRPNSEYHPQPSTNNSVILSPLTPIGHIGTLGRGYPSLRAAHVNNGATNDNLLANASGVYVPVATAETPIMFNDGSSYNDGSGFYDAQSFHKRPTLTNYPTGTNGNHVEAGSLSRLNGSMTYNLSNQNHIQNNFPQHRTVVPSSHGTGRAAPKQLQRAGTLTSNGNLPQSHSMMNYSHTQLNHPGNLLRDSNQVLTNASSNHGGAVATPNSQFKSETKLFQPRSLINNTYGEDLISSKSLLFANQNRVASPVSNCNNQNLPAIKRPTSVKCKKPTSKESSSNFDTGDPQSLRARAGSMQTPSSSIYRSDYEINNDQQFLGSQRAGRPPGHTKVVHAGSGSSSNNAVPKPIANENRLAMQYGGVQTNENPLYNAAEYQSQVAQRLAQKGNQRTGIPKNGNNSVMSNGGVPVPQNQLNKKSYPPKTTASSKINHNNHLVNSNTCKPRPAASTCTTADLDPGSANVIFNSDAFSNDSLRSPTSEAEYMDLEEFSLTEDQSLANRNSSTNHKELTIDI